MKEIWYIIGLIAYQSKLFYKHENNLAMFKILDWLYTNYVTIVLKSVVGKAIRKDILIFLWISCSFTMPIKSYCFLALILGAMVGNKAAKYLLVDVDEQMRNSESGPGKQVK